MRDNGPLTGIERPFPQGKTIVSKTDLAGRITEVNDTFVEVSGFAAEELIGKAHNIVRHPDVPPTVFAHLWATLRQDRPWRGVVKNRCKNGDHYWVDAYVVPLRQHGRTVGYMSVRMEASAEQIEHAQAQYLALKDHAPRSATPRLASTLSVRHGVLAGTLFVLFAVLFGAFVAIGGIGRSADVVHELQRNSDLAMTVARANQDVSGMHAQVLLALEHGPDGRGSGGGDAIDLGTHLKVIKALRSDLEQESLRIAELGRLVAAEPAASAAANGRAATPAAAAAAALDRFLRAQRRFVDEGIQPLIGLLTDRQVEETQQLLVDIVGPLAATLHDESEAVARSLGERAGELRRADDALVNRTVKLVSIWLVVTLSVVAVSGLVFFRTTIGPLRRAIGHMERIAGGNLSERVDVFGFGEPGQVVDAVATMQVQLKVMLDEIGRASSDIGQQVQRLNVALVQVVDSTEEQYQQASQISASLEGTGVDTRRLADCARASFEQLGRLAGEARPIDAAELAELVRLARETATLAELNAFAASEISRQSGRISSLAAENRASVNEAWSAGVQLGETSKQLHGMLEKFD